MHALASEWGVRLDASPAPSTGKTVWFAPATTFDETTRDPRLGDDPVIPTAPAPVAASPTAVSVHLLDIPVKPLVYYRTRYQDLRRELSLIALREEGSSTVAHRLTQLAHELEGYQSLGADNDRKVDAAFERDADRIDLTYSATPELGAACLRLHDLLEEANAYCGSEQLLTLAAGAQERQIRTWFLEDFTHQIQGGQPRPWTGSFDLETDSSADYLAPHLPNEDLGRS